MRSARKSVRTKLSTTVAPENYAYLESQVRSGKAANLAAAVDVAIERQRRLENRARLAKATSDYFNGLTDEDMAKENALGEAMQEGARGIDFDREL
jgi:hypothetical protein